MVREGEGVVRVVSGEVSEVCEGGVGQEGEGELGGLVGNRLSHSIKSELT